MIRVEMKSNIDAVLKKYTQLEKRMPTVFKRFIISFYEYIGLQATGNYMKVHTINREEQQFGVNSPGRNYSKTLRIVTGRLARSIKRIYNFNQAGAGANESWFKFKKQGKVGFVASIGSQVPYALIHEKGGTIHHTNLFGRGISADIQIPKRPYMAPAAEKAKSKVSPIFEHTVKQILGEFNG